MTILKKIFIVLLCSTFLGSVSAKAPENETNIVAPNTQAIDWVWSGQRVWFDFVSTENHQMIAYYDASRQMSIAVREMGDVNGGTWIYHKLPSFLGWDAHNSVTAAFDKKGFIHVVGNIHANRLVYFRSTEPYNPRSLKQVKVMVDVKDEQQMTYPEFFIGNNNELYFKYRSGTSGQGQWYYNNWDETKHSWSHLHQSTLLDGENIRGVYPKGPVFGPDGYAHMFFVWRETPIASSNHDLSYARSKDLIHWETSSGKPIKLPITLKTGEIVDPIPMHGGLLNRTPVGFDIDKRVVVLYQKYDANGNSQVYISRREKSGWKETKVSSWENSRVDLHKSGALDLPLLTNDPVFYREDGQLIVPATWHGVDWEWVVDNKSLAVLSGKPVEKNLPAAITQYDLDNGIPQRVRAMRKNQKQPSATYFISWEAQQPNRDQARADISMPSTLRMHRVNPVEK